MREILGMKSKDAPACRVNQVGALRERAQHRLVTGMVRVVVVAEECEEHAGGAVLVDNAHGATAGCIRRG